MEHTNPLSKEEKKKVFWKSFKQAAYASYIGIGILFGGVVVAPLVLYQIGLPVFESISTGLLIYISFQFYNFPIFYSQNYNNSFEKYYESELLRIKHYGKSHAYLSAAFAIIHKMNRINPLTFEMAVSELSKFCTLIKEFFEVKNDAICACCIKILVKGDKLEPGDYRVITLCRDSKSEASREPANIERIHTVKGNTCFLHFFENVNTHEGQFFLSNDLTKHVGYQNSSFDYYGRSTPQNWTLPYKSEIVVPLIPKIRDEDSLALGFFCVDSQGVENFNAEFDPEMLIGVSDGLYNTIYNQVKNKYGIASK